MDPAALLNDAFGRIDDLVPRAVEGLDVQTLSVRPGATGNSIAWLIWHLSRIQDDHVAAVAGTDQVWLSDGWRERFDLSLPPRSTGYDHDPAEVAAVSAPADLLAGYYGAVAARTHEFLSGLTGADLDRVVDERWTPPVTLGARLVSVLSDCLQHVGQAAYIRGLDR